jgi:predicted dehydrogenase
VVISTPDHQHAILAVDAVRAGKDVYLQKPASLTIAEGRAMSNAVMASGQILQIGSQQRSWKQFHRACELVRNGRIGDVKHVEIGLPGDPSAGRTRRRCRYLPTSTTTHGWGARRRSTTPRCACIRSRVSAGPAGCAASSSAPA